MESVQLKIEFENSLRRVTVGRSESLAKLKATIMSFLESEGVVDFDVKYRDEENDLITIGSDLELQEFLATANSSDKTTEKKILRLIVALKDVAPNATPRADPPASAPPRPTAEPQAPQSQAADMEEEPAPEIPWINLARALAQPEVVERVQQLLQSPVITETINRAARGYVDSKGDVMIAGLMAAQQVPLLLALIAEVLDELPVLKDLQTLVVSMFQQHCNAAAAPGAAAGCPASFPFGGPRMMPPFCFPRPPHHHHGGPPHPCPPHHPHPPHHPPHGGHPHHGPHHHPHHPHHGGPGDQQEGPQKHFGVFCDGCGSDEQLKRASIAAGHQTRRGFIRGLRYNSQSVHDFDLCESCKGTDRFPDSAYGPFVTIQPPACQQQQRGGRGGCGGPWWARAGGNWRAQGVQPTPPQEQQTSAQTKEAKPSQPAQAEFDFMDAIRSALSRGTEAFVEASKNENNDFGDIARAIAESLKDSAKPKEAQQGEKAVPASQPAAPVAVKETQQPAEAKDDWVPVATPVASEQDPFVKWATQLSQLEALGFDNSETYIKFLEEEKGDLDRVVSRIVNRDLM